MKIIMGLGNPGKQYSHNRHNVGFHCIDLLAAKYSVRLNARQCLSDTGDGRIDSESVILAKPRTFVNLSGNAAKRLLGKFKSTPQDLIVIHDDLDLPAGRVRVRQGGSSGGHRGIRSIIHDVGSHDFARVRIGISRPLKSGDDAGYADDIVNYVLGDITLEEKKLIVPAIELAVEAIACLINDGISAAMNTYNKH